MTTRDRIAHVRRRFGFGSTNSELDEAEKMGLEACIDNLIDYEKIPDDFPFNPWEFAFYGDKQVALDPGRFLAWWCMRMVLTPRPLEEKLTIFWHDHFAISGSKVEFGPLMLRNNQTIRKHACGKFDELLLSMVQDPAMIQFLDCDSNLKGSPNENFAREVLELFTLGIGNYSEKDVQEAARAYTGWGLRYAIDGSGGERALYDQALRAVKADRPLVTSAFSEDLHDSGKKSVLGTRANFDWKTMSQLLATRPETARHLAKKLWEFFASPNPEPTVVEKLSSEFLKSGGQIKPMLRAMAASPDFYSERCVRRIVKCPADFVIPIVRQLNARNILLNFRKKDAQAWTPVPNEIAGTAGLCAGSMFQMGMLLFYPPNVGGWEWGKAWITSDSMRQRIRFADLLFQTAPDRAVAELIRAQMLMAGKGKSTENAVDFLLQTFDVPTTAEQMKLLNLRFDSSGGTAALSDKMRASKAIGDTLRLAFSTPEFQFC